MSRAMCPVTGTDGATYQFVCSRFPYIHCSLIYCGPHTQHHVMFTREPFISWDVLY